MPDRAIGQIGHDTHDLYRLLVERVPDYAIAALDASGNIVSWNAGATRRLGYDPKDAVGRHFSMLYPPEDVAAGVPEATLGAAAREGRVEREGWCVRQGGARFWGAAAITALRDDSGELLGFAAVLRDLTERRRSEAALRETEQRFRLLVHSVRDYGIFMLDPQGYVASWNEGAARIKGYMEHEIIGRHFSVFYPASDVAAGKPKWELEEAVREGRFEDEGWRVRRDGSLFWANVIITPLYEQGTLVGFAKMTRDLTERRAAHAREVEHARRIAAEEAARVTAEGRARELAELAARLRERTAQLARRTREAEAANRAKADFLAAMSHELRTPLNAIGGFAELMALGLRGPLTELQRQDIERIRRSQRHLLAIINDILNFSRIEAGQLSYDVRPVPMREVLASVVEMLESQAIERGLRLEAEGVPADAVVLADRAKTEQIVLNVLSNALKFTPTGGMVRAACVTASDHVALTISDTGIGIAAEEQQAIFEPFVQVGRSLTRTSQGTGLGLAISRDLARAMGGDLTVESLKGAGSTFTLRLPRVRGEREPGGGSAES
ncbi:MAG TPA: PAS domain S-box protein [Gemmatimonadaceae bacterium]